MDANNKIIKVRNLNVIILAIIILLAISIIYFYNSKNMNHQIVEASEIVIPVEGMTCGSCEHHIETEVKTCDGVIDIKADHEKGEVYAKFDNNKLTVDDIVKEINKTGYKAMKP